MKGEITLHHPICPPHYHGLIRFADPSGRMRLWYVFDTSADARVLNVRTAMIRDRIAWRIGRAYWTVRHSVVDAVRTLTL